MVSKIAHIVDGKAKDLGDNFFVRRTLPTIKKRMVVPFVFWDHMGPTEVTPEKEMVVRAHPHIGLSTITYLFAGEIMHRDSLQNEVPIRPGEVNWMTAGSGISHSERVKAVDSPIPLEGIQLWVALPKEHEDVEPSFIHAKESELPIIEKNGFTLRLIAGEALSKKSPLPVFSKMYYLNGKSTSKGQMTFPVSQNEEAALYVISGDVSIEGQSFRKYTMVIMKPGENIDIVSQGPCEFMILGGEIFPEKRHVWWNFVSSDREKIEAAKQRWLDNDFGTVINESEKIPLPDK